MTEIKLNSDHSNTKFRPKELFYLEARLLWYNPLYDINLFHHTLNVQIIVPLPPSGSKVFGSKCFKCSIRLGVGFKRLFTKQRGLVFEAVKKHFENIDCLAF